LKASNGKASPDMPDMPDTKKHELKNIEERPAEKHRAWRIEFPDRPAKLVFCSPESSRDEVLTDYPAAVRAEPLTPPMTSPGTPMSRDEEAEILEWLDRIGEHDPTTRAEVLTACRQDAGARAYYLRRSREAI
jgi:hypothetical protein